MSRGVKILLTVAILCAALYFGLVWFVHSHVEKGIRNVAQKHEAVVDWESLDVDLFTRSVSLSGVKMVWMDREYAADFVEFGKLDSKNSPPHYAKIEIRGGQIPVSAMSFGWIAPILHGMGMTDLQGDLVLDYAFDTGDNSLHVKRFNANINDLGSLSMKAVLHDVDPRHLQAERLVGLAVGDMDMHFTDGGFLDRLSGVLITGTPEQRRRKLAATLTLLARGAEANDNTLAGATYSTLGRFVRSGGTLTVKTAPEEPVPWLYMYMGNSPERMARMLGLEMSVESDGGATEEQ